MKKQVKKSVPKKASAKKVAKPAKKSPAKAATATAVSKTFTKVDEKLMHQIDWLTADVVNGYFMGVDSDILSKAEIKKLKEDCADHQEIFDHLSVDQNTSADFAEFLLFYMHTLVFEGAAPTVLKEWKEDAGKATKKKK
ncbi:MAG TPA: hypothetical protein VGF30_12510 [Bacteroidia bacterium]